MRKVIINSIVIFCVLSSQAIASIINLECYKPIAEIRLQELYAKEIKNNKPMFFTKTFLVQPSQYVSAKYEIEALRTISIPILEWKQNTYKCGDKIENLILFEKNCLFQKVLVVESENNQYIASFNIYDSYNKKMFKNDSIENLPYPLLHGEPVLADNRDIEEKIFSYITSRSDIFVFMIRGMRGYWSIANDGNIKKLIMKHHKIKEVSADEYIKCYYGQERINDIIHNEERTGPYHGCKCYK